MINYTSKVKKPNTYIFQASLFFLLVLFPVAGNTIKSWTSVTFWLIVLLALIDRPWKRIRLEKIERQVLFTVGLIFCAILLSSILNGWGQLQTRGLGVQLRYLGFLALYFVIRAYPDCLKAITLGSIAGSAVLTAQGLFDTIHLGLERSYGLYQSPGLIATQATAFMLLTGFSALWPRFTGVSVRLSILGFFFAIFALILSGSRATLAPAALTVFLVLLFELTRLKKILAIITFSLICVTIYQTVPIIENQTKRGIAEITAYFSIESAESHTDHGSAGVRLQMWRSATHLFKENPVFGIGWRNFSEDTKPLAERGLVSAQVVGSPHPHSTYLEFLAGYGLVGFLLLLSFYFLSLRAAYQAGPKQNPSAKLFLWFLVFYVLNGVNEGGLFIYGNSVSFFFVFYSVFLAELMKEGAYKRPAK